MLLTTGQAAAELEMAVTTFRRLIHAGLIPDTTNRGVRAMVPLTSVLALAGRNTPRLCGLPEREIAVLRVEPAKPRSNEAQPQTGFSTTLAAPSVLAALQDWWRCDAPSVARGGVLPVTVAGFVVALLTGLDRWETNAQGRHRFPGMQLAGYVTDLVSPVTRITAATPQDRDLAQLLLATRLPSHSGGPIAYVSTRNAEPNEGP